MMGVIEEAQHLATVESSFYKLLMRRDTADIEIMLSLGNIFLTVILTFASDAVARLKGLSQWKGGTSSRSRLVTMLNSGT